MKTLIGCASLILASLSATGFASVHCECSGSCGSNFTATAWSEYPGEWDAKTRCRAELNGVCLNYGYPYILENTVIMNCTQNGAPIPNPTPTPPMNEQYRCQVDLVTMSGIRATFYGTSLNQNEAINIASQQCYNAITSPQEYCKNVGCIL